MSEPVRRMKALARRFLPPVVVDLLRRGGEAPAAQFSGNYPDFAAAVAAASASGYEGTAVIEGTIQRTREIRDAIKAAPTRGLNAWALQDLAALYVLGAGRTDGTLRVLDFGGGMGVHYFTLRPLLPGTAGVRWTICETAATARAGREHFANDELEFISDLDGVSDRFDVVLASGALQYTDSPVRYFSRLSELSDRLILNRMPFFDGTEDRVSLQNVASGFYQASLPVWFLSEQRWLAEIARRELEIALRWAAPEDTAAIDDRAVVYQGLALRRRR